MLDTDSSISYQTMVYYSVCLSIMTAYESSGYGCCTLVGGIFGELVEDSLLRLVSSTGSAMCILQLSFPNIISCFS